jgi:hypothetical protein
MFNFDRFEPLLGGSIARFKKREHPPLLEAERELKLKNERKLQDGLIILIKLRTEALNEQTLDERQNLLEEAHQFSEEMAEEVINLALLEKPVPINTVLFRKTATSQG